MRGRSLTVHDVAQRAHVRKVSALTPLRDWRVATAVSRHTFRASSSRGRPREEDPHKCGLRQSDSSDGQKIPSARQVLGRCFLYRSRSLTLQSRSAPPIVPTARLKRPVPAVRSVMTRTVKTPMVATLMPLQELRDNENRIIGCGREQQSANRLRRKADEQQRPTPALLRMKADPRSKNGHRLRRDDQAGHPDRHFCSRLRHSSRSRQHRSVGKPKQQRRR
jgi:hypothetical protein